MSASNGRVEEGVVNPAAGKPARARGARVDAGGLWTNLALTPQDSALMAWRHGGSVACAAAATCRSRSPDRSMCPAARAGPGGCSARRQGRRRHAGGQRNATGGVLTVAGEIAGYGVDGGGKLLLQAERVSVGHGRQIVAPGVSVLDGLLRQRLAIRSGRRAWPGGRRRRPRARDHAGVALYGAGAECVGPECGAGNPDAAAVPGRSAQAR